MPFTSCNTTAAMVMGRRRFPSTASRPDSRYWKDLNVGDGRVVFGGGLLDKFGWSEGQKVTLRRQVRGARTIRLEYMGKDCAWGSKSDMNIYMSIDDFNEAVRQ